MKKVKVVIKGTSPILMHKFVEGLNASKMEPKDVAEAAAYRTKDGMLCVPSENVRRMLSCSAKFTKGKGRSSLMSIAAATIMIEPENLSLGTREFILDARSCVNPVTRGRVMSYRPRLDEWKLTFFIKFDPDLLTIKQVEKIVIDAGKLVGLLDFRPQKNGNCGRFELTEFQLV